MRQPADDADLPDGVLGGEVHATEIGDRLASEAVVDVVSAVLDREPTDLRPLYDVVDPDALDSLCDARELDARPTVRFEYEGLLVTVSASDAISVVEP